jgi:hypothetical protein
MRISICADELVGVAAVLSDQLRARGHETVADGVLLAEIEAR